MKIKFQNRVHLAFQYIRHSKKQIAMSASGIEIKKERWLFTVFLVLFIAGIFGFFIFDTSELSANSRSKESIPLELLLVTGIFLAPIFEELAFRAAFIRSKIYIIICLLLMAGFVLMSYENYYAVVAFVFFIIVFVLYKKTNSPFLFKLVCISNAVLFGLVHYKIEDFASFDRGFIVLFQISIGFLLIWVTINYGLVRSMIIHGTYNAMALGFVVYGLQFPDTSPKIYDDENIKVEWQHVPYFESFSSNFNMTNDSIITEGIKLPVLYPSLNVTDTLRQQNMIIIDPYIKYNFRIILKENAVNTDIDLATESFLLKENLIMPNTDAN